MQLLRSTLQAIRALPHGVSPWRDFRRMGAGIEARYGRCRSWWSFHLQASRQFIAKNTRPAHKVAVLGAGRLLDIDIVALATACDEVHLFDLDPGALDVWRAALPPHIQPRVIFRCEDVTSCIREWSSQLHRASIRGGVSEFFRVHTAPTPYWVEEGFDGIISLNILGQIPLYWRDRVFEIIGSDVDRYLSELEESMGDLQQMHVKGVQSALSWSISITDTEYLYYQQPASTWSFEAALHTVGNSTWMEYAARSTAREFWWWHIAPQFIERDDYGEVHRVEAVATLRQ